jgi:hypothetical protein
MIEAVPSIQQHHFDRYRPFEHWRSNPSSRTMSLMPIQIFRIADSARRFDRDSQKALFVVHSGEVSTQNVQGSSPTNPTRRIVRQTMRFGFYGVVR